MEICFGDTYFHAMLVPLVAGAWLAGIHHGRATRPPRLLFIESWWTRLRFRLGLRWFL